MELKVIRKIFTEKSTIGELYVDGIFQCFTLEDKDRGLTDDMTLEEINSTKVFAETAIPYGEYKVIIDFSNHFQKSLPHILNVKGFEGIRIHSGNTDKDTEGCILVGKTKEIDFIGDSRLAFSELAEKLQGQEDIIISIEKEININI